MAGEISNVILFDERHNLQDEDAQNKIASLEDEVGSIITKINRNDIIIITDSYGNYPDTASSYIALLKRWLKDKYNNIYSNAVNGSGYGRAGNTFLQALQALEASITDKGDVIEIYVLGGANDRLNTDAIRTGAQEFAAYAKQTYPNASLYTGFLGYNTAWDAVAGMYEACRIYTTLQDYGISYLPGSDQCLRRLGIGNDGLHPNTYGAYCLARGCYNLITNKACSIITEQRQLTYALGDNISAVNNLSGVLEFRRNGTANYFFGTTSYISIDLKSAINFSTTQHIKVLKLNDADVTFRGEFFGVCPLVKIVVNGKSGIGYCKLGQDQWLVLNITGGDDLGSSTNVTITANFGIRYDDFYSD